MLNSYSNKKEERLKINKVLSQKIGQSNSIFKKKIQENDKDKSRI